MKLILSILIYTFPLVLISQKAPVKWKEISKEVLQMQSYEMDPSAPAVILCDYGNIFFDTKPNGKDLFLFYRRHVRIKVFNEEGIKHAKLSIPFLDLVCERFNEGNAFSIKAMVYNLSKNGELNVTKFKKKNIKYRDSTNCMRIAEVEFPDVKPGSVIEYIYEKPSLDFVSPESWHFQHNIPTMHSEIRLRTPEFFQYMISSQNVENFDINEETNFSKSLLYTAYLGTRYQRNYHFNMSGKQIRIIKYHVEAFNAKNFIGNPKNHVQKLNIHLSRAIKENFGYVWDRLTHSLVITTVEDYNSYQPIQRSSIPYPAGYIIYQLPDWEKLNSGLLKDRRFGLPLIKFWEYQIPLNKMIEGKTEPMEKMISIYDYIRKNIKWNGENSMFVRPVFSPGLSKIYTKFTRKLIKEKSLGKPFNNKLGSSSEINFILIYLLNKAGIETHPVIISTVNNGEIDSNIADPRQFNHALAYAKIGEQAFFLDATDSIRPYTLLDKNHLTLNGFLVEGKDFGWIPIHNNEQIQNDILEKIKIDIDFNLTRQTTLKENGYDALAHRQEILRLGKESFIKSFKKTKTNTEQFDQVEIENINESSQGLVFKLSKSTKVNSSEYLITPFFDPVYNEENFSEFVRQCPIVFNYPFVKRYFLEAEIPEGYEVILPESSSFSCFGNNAKYNYTALQENNTIKISINLSISKQQFPKHEYENLKKLFTELNDKVKEKIIIKKLKP